ncbi:MAG: succinylglutamate desuccinylase/aspartoacylase family protein [Bacillota bacterium]
MRQVTFEPTSVTAFDLYEFGDGRGPVVMITAGIHGDEQTAIHAARLLVQRLGEEPVHGKVKVVPVANPASFRNRTRTSPFDQLDLNRVFPGSPAGSQTLQLAHRLWEEAQEAEYIVDLHCAGWGSVPYTLALYQEFPAMREVAIALGIPVVVQSNGTRGQLFVEACHAGRKALIIELPGGQPGGFVDVAAAQMACEAVQNLLRFIGVLEGEPTRSDVVFYGRIQVLEAPGPGLFLPSVRPGAVVDEGTVLGHFEGEPVRAPFAGVAVSVSLPRYCFAGERMVGIAPLVRNGIGGGAVA